MKTQVKSKTTKQVNNKSINTMKKKAQSKSKVSATAQKVIDAVVPKDPAQELTIWQAAKFMNVTAYEVYQLLTEVPDRTLKSWTKLKASKNGKAKA
jgi:hypothetical protein